MSLPIRAFIVERSSKTSFPQLEHEPTLIEWIGKARSGKDTIRKIQDLLPDILITDLFLGEENGFDLAREILRLYPAMKILIQTDFMSQEYCFRAYQMGVHGILAKSSSVDELVRVILLIANGLYYFPLQSLLFEPHLNKLSLREKEVMSLIAEGYTYDMIATQLNLSSGTVTTYVRRLKDKLGLKTYKQLVFHVNIHFRQVNW